MRPSSLRAAGVAFALLIAFGAPGVARADDTLTVIAGAAPGLFDALDLVAQGAGFFKDEHLDVEREHAANAGVCAQLVATGKADVCSLSVEPVLVGYDKGLRLQFFLARSAQYSYVLGVLDDSPIRSLGDFKGTELGENSLGSAAEVATQSMLAGAGLTKNDYALVPIGVGAQAISAIVNKRVAGLADTLSDLVTYEVAGNITFRVFRHPILKDIANVGYAALPATIAAKSDVLQRYSRAIVEAALFIRTNPRAAARLYLRYQVGGLRVTPDAVRDTARELTLLQDFLPAADPSNPRIGLLPPHGLELYSRYLADFGMIPRPVPGDAVATDRFVRYANDFDHRAVRSLARRMP